MDGVFKVLESLLSSKNNIVSILVLIARTLNFCAVQANMVPDLFTLLSHNRIPFIVSPVISKHQV
jgi:hypothetical protein